jgi:ubiquinol-cytochrome c reductase cytochrome b subunit
MNYDDRSWPGGTEPFYPNEVLRHCYAVAVTLAIFLSLVFFFPGLFSGSEAPADPSTTPLHIKPEWYFLLMYQFLKLIPSGALGPLTGFAGILITFLSTAIIVLLPFIDRSPQRDIKKRPFFLVGSFVVIIAAIILTILGALS